MIPNLDFCCSAELIDDIWPSNLILSQTESCDLHRNTQTKEWTDWSTFWQQVHFLENMFCRVILFYSMVFNAASLQLNTFFWRHVHKLRPSDRSNNVLLSAEWFLCSFCLYTFKKDLLNIFFPTLSCFSELVLFICFKVCTCSYGK